MKTFKRTNRIVLSLILVLTIFSSCSSDDDVKTTERTEVNIPDANFEQALIDLDIDTNGLNGTILIADAEAVTELDVSEKNISSLQGVDAFINLEDLECYGNNLTNLDISDNLKLKRLFCENNLLTSLDVSNNLDLEYLGVYENQLTSIDVSNNINLKGLYCSDNQITNLNLESNINLGSLNCSSNYISSIDISNNTNLTWLKVNHNQLTELDLSQHSLLVEFEGSFNELTSLNVKNGNNLNIFNFNVRNNSNLYCIKVDDAIWSNVNWSSGIDGLSAFSEDCN